MPQYEYRCLNCRRRTTLLVLNLATYAVPPCPHCQNGILQKLISRFAVLKSEEARFEEMADPSSFGDIDEEDPKSIARWAKRMGEQMGEDLGDDFDEMVEQLEAGDVPPDDAAAPDGSDD